jgi:hypothetical protein
MRLAVRREALAQPVPSVINSCLNDAPCPPLISHGASIRQPLGALSGAEPVSGC